MFVSGRFTVKLAPPSLRPLMTSKLEEEVCGVVGEETGDEEGEIAVLSLVVSVRKRGMVGDIV